MAKSKYILFDFSNNLSFSVDFASPKQVIRDIRKGHRMSQAELGQALGFSTQQIQRFETKQDPPLEFWRKFCRKFKVNLPWTLWGEGPAMEESPRDPSTLVAFATQDLENELKMRKRMADACRAKARKLRAELCNRGFGGQDFASMRAELERVAKLAIPYKAPNWLREDLKDLHLEKL